MSQRLQIEGLHVAIGGKAILQDVSLHAEPGRITAIVGPNGAGKTTLLRALLGLVPVQAGSIRLGTSAITDLPPQTRARELAWVPQRSSLDIDLQVHEVVAMGCFARRPEAWSLVQDDRKRIDDALAACDATGLAQRRFLTLSGGEQARVLIARALTTGAPLLCLDEPAANLDAGHRLDCYALCRRLADEGRTILLVMHDLLDARRYTDDCILLHDGRLVQSGPSETVIADAIVGPVYGIRLRETTSLSIERDGAGEHA